MKYKRGSESRETSGQYPKKRFGLSGILVAAFQFGTTLAVIVLSLFVFPFSSEPNPVLFRFFNSFGWIPFLFLVGASVMIQGRIPGRKRWVAGVSLAALLINLFLFLAYLFSGYLTWETSTRSLHLMIQAVNLIFGGLFFRSLFQPKSDVNVTDNDESQKFLFLYLFFRNAIGAGVLGIVFSIAFSAVFFLIS